ncbi:methyltransferase domain-containing protein [Mycoplasma sp. P36-A1]|uniref:methyltransferase domain-containing protein n=1 Tax=Mycoplasma sp. P36-A1 TaxID=3252900 RepID=UPI003C2CD337
MKIKKIEKAINIYHNNENILVCPICSSSLEIAAKSLICSNKHTFNFNKKGYLTLSNKVNNEIYDLTLFNARNTIMNSGMYKALVDKINDIIIENFSCYERINILDAGCGDGYFLNEVANSLNDTNSYLGLDLSSKAIEVATNYESDLLLMVADLARIPLKNESIDVILNILSPANYHEFSRILNKDGLIIKVVPNTDYLVQLRELIFDDKTYDNAKIIETFKQNTTFVNSYNIKYDYALDSNLFDCLIKMTPLTNNLDTAAINHIYDNKFTYITVDLCILIGRV